ncbi:hypothetical protein BGX30_008430 [Mortierella sp. GBA39]|nr:hypothetical protein BGX30_008430 [Mortierella sp. GBA39]
MDQPMRGKQGGVHADRSPIGRALSNGFQHHISSWDRSDIGRPWAMYTKHICCYHVVQSHRINPTLHCGYQQQILIAVSRG